VSRLSDRGSPALVTTMIQQPDAQPRPFWPRPGASRRRDGAPAPV